MFLHVDSKDSDQTGQMPRLILVFAGAHAILLVLSRGGSFIYDYRKNLKSLDTPKIAVNILKFEQ